MPTIGSIIGGGESQVIARVPGGAPGTESYLVRKLRSDGVAATDATARSSGTPATETAGPLSPEEKRIIAELEARDRAVRNEEERHAATAGQFGGAPQYTYRRGPDGKMYAVEGKVPIRLGNAGGTPEEQEKALRRVQAAAVSVQAPSSGDYAAVAGAATSLAAQEKGEAASPAEKRREAEAAYRNAQKNAEAAGLARELFGAIADRSV